MNETENKITPITRNDIAFNRRHLYESEEVKIGKKTFLVTSVFPIEIENGDTLDLCQYLGHKKLNFFLSCQSLIFNLLWCLVIKSTMAPLTVVE